MAVKIVLKGTAMMGGQNTPDWYRHDTENLAGVTNLPSNEALGLDSVLIFPPSDLQAENGMVCAVILKTVIGDVRATVYQSKNNPGTIYCRPPQSREEKEDGEVVYHDEVKMTSKLIAQVLRFIETQVDIVEEKPAENEDGLPPVGTGVGISKGFTSIPAGNVDQHADTENPFEPAK